MWGLRLHGDGELDIGQLAGFSECARISAEEFIVGVLQHDRAHSAQSIHFGQKGLQSGEVGVTPDK